MCDFSPKVPKPKIAPVKEDLPEEPPRPIEIERPGKKREKGNPLRIDLASTDTRGKSGAQV